MEISYQLTADDYRQGFKAFRRRTTFARLSNIFGYVCFFVVLAAALLLSILGPDHTTANLFPLWVLAAFWAWYLWYCPYHVAKKLLKGSPAAAVPHTLEISDSGVHSRSPISESRFSWDLIVGWAEAERVFALFPSPISFIPIAKRAMSEQQQNELRSLLASKFPKESRDARMARI